MQRSDRQARVWLDRLHRAERRAFFVRRTHGIPNGSRSRRGRASIFIRPSGIIGAPPLSLFRLCLFLAA